VVPLIDLALPEDAADAAKHPRVILRAVEERGDDAADVLESRLDHLFEDDIES